MTLFTRWLRRLYEKVKGIFYEGPNPPKRLGDAVAVFAEMNPKATRIEWILFCTQLAEASYKSGWLRGYEWSERELDIKPEHDPDRIADALLNNWRASEPVRLHNVNEQVTTEAPVDPNVMEILSNERQYFENRVGVGPSR